MTRSKKAQSRVNFVLYMINVMDVLLFLQQTQVVEAWTHSGGRCYNAESELRLDLASLRIDEEVIWDGVLNVKEALFVSTTHALLDGDFTNFLIIKIDGGCATTIRGDEAEQEREVGLKSLVLDDILNELAILGITIVLATIAAAGGTRGILGLVPCFTLLFASGYVVKGASLKSLFFCILSTHV